MTAKQPRIAAANTAANEKLLNAIVSPHDKAGILPPQSAFLQAEFFGRERQSDWKTLSVLIKRNCHCLKENGPTRKHGRGPADRTTIAQSASAKFHRPNHKNHITVVRLWRTKSNHEPVRRVAEDWCY